MKHVHEDYLLDTHRLASFKNWPSTLKQKPLELVEAGFFSLDSEDKVTCFSCGLCLKDWKPLDEPWIEHAKWSASCQHVTQNMDAEFIKKHECINTNKYNITINIPNNYPIANYNNENVKSYHYLTFCLIFLGFVIMYVEFLNYFSQ